MHCHYKSLLHCAYSFSKICTVFEMMLLQINLYKSRLCVCTQVDRRERERESKNCSEIMIKCCAGKPHNAFNVKCVSRKKFSSTHTPFTNSLVLLFMSHSKTSCHLLFCCSPRVVDEKKNIITIKNGSAVAIAVIIIICLRVPEKKNESTAEKIEMRIIKIWQRLNLTTWSFHYLMNEIVQPREII